MLKIFTLKYEEKSELFSDSIMTNFLADKEVLKWKSHFFERRNEYFWTVLLEYRTLFPIHESVVKKEGSKNESYKEILSDNDWPLFNILREWRTDMSKKEGIPPYIICTNIQMANIVIKRPVSLNALQEIEGIGKAKIEKYGREILQIIASHGKPVKNEEKEE
jgi:superfamily II DNA helicase RecQ